VLILVYDGCLDVVWEVEGDWRGEDARGILRLVGGLGLSSGTFTSRLRGKVLRSFLIVISQAFEITRI
jgi:hypothetical protein